MELEKRSIIAGVLMCCVLCGITLLVSAQAKKTDKDVKVPSSTITAIKNEMWQMMEEQETTDEPASVDLTPKPTGNDDTRQGETPQVQPRSAALPP